MLHAKFHNQVVFCWFEKRFHATLIVNEIFFFDVSYSCLPQRSTETHLWCSIPYGMRALELVKLNFIIIVSSLDMSKISNHHDQKIKFKCSSWLYKKLTVPNVIGMFIECLEHYLSSFLCNRPKCSTYWPRSMIIR